MDGAECNARPMQIQDGHCGEARRSWHCEGMHVELGQFTTVRVHSCLAYTQKHSLSIYLPLLARAVRQQKSRAADYSLRSFCIPADAPCTMSSPFAISTSLHHPPSALY